MGLQDRAMWRVHKAVRLAVTALQRIDHRFYIDLDYPPTVENAPRYGYGRAPHPELMEIMRHAEGRFAETLRTFVTYADDLAKIDVHATDPREPSWVNDYIPGLDGAALYCFVRERKPALYIEIGSGNSTKFVARARRDEGCSTHLTSIDPYPRAEVDALCDEIIRRPLEAVSLSAFESLRAGDILFFDGSHRAFMNSDVVAFFLDVLPAVAPGVLVGVHDIYLPNDYPSSIADRYYSEQYLLAAYLLGGADVEIELAARHVSDHPQLGRGLDDLWRRPGLGPVERFGVTFWFTKRASSSRGDAGSGRSPSVS